MNPADHPLVTRYLDDLARMLDQIPPGERAEVLAGVREHIETSLAERGSATDADVSAVLSELGPPDEVAREAYRANLGGGGVSSPPGTPISWLERPWVPVLIGVLQMICLLLLAFGAVIQGGMLTLPLWLAIALLVAGSSLWTRTQKWMHAAVILTSLVVAVAIQFMMIPAVALVALLAGSLVAVMWLTTVGLRGAHTLEATHSAPRP